MGVRCGLMIIVLPNCSEVTLNGRASGVSGGSESEKKKDSFPNPGFAYLSRSAGLLIFNCLYSPTPVHQRKDSWMAFVYPPWAFVKLRMATMKAGRRRWSRSWHRPQLVSRVQSVRRCGPNGGLSEMFWRGMFWWFLWCFIKQGLLPIWGFHSKSKDNMLFWVNLAHVQVSWFLQHLGFLVGWWKQGNIWKPLKQRLSHPDDPLHAKHARP